MTLTAAGVVSRINPGVLEEGALGRIAEKSGKKINLEHYALGNNYSDVKNKYKEIFGDTKEVLINPETGKPFPKKIFVGEPYIIKLFKDSESATSAVGIGSTDQNEQATKGGKESASSISNMEVNALLAHGAKDILKEVRDNKGQRNNELFNSFMSGTNHSLKVKDTYVMDKFNSILEQFNVSVEKDNDNFTYKTKMLNSDEIISRSNGEVTNSKTVDIKNKKGTQGGLFDDNIFGGINGSKTGFIRLKKRILNPMHEEELSEVVGLTKAEFLNRIKTGRQNDLIDTIKHIDIDEKINETKDILNATPDIDKVNKKVKLLKYLNSVKSSNKSLYEAGTMSAVSVIPPKFRPVQLKKNKLSMDGINILYQDIIDLSSASNKDKSNNELDYELYQSVGALYGTHASPNPSINSEETRGFLSILKGTNPKKSYVQKNLTRKKQFMSGRGVIKPARGDIGIDEIELPENMAMKMYRPHLEIVFKSRGMDREQIEKELDSKSENALHELDKVVKQFPVYYTRSPALWKHNIVGATPKIIKGNTIGINPLLERGFNADYDGDAIAVYATSNNKSAQEVKDKLYPSKNLFTEDTNMTKSDLLIMPDQDSSLGFYKASIKSSKKPIKVSSVSELLKMLSKGDINYNDQIIM
jgi:hypothetical protein